MKTALFALLLIAIVTCRPDPGLFDAFFDAVDQGAQEVEGFLKNISSATGAAAAAARKKGSDKGRIGGLAGVLGTLADGDASTATKEPQKKARKRNKVKKKREGECPSRVPKTKRVVLNSQARHIVANVYDFMKAEANRRYAERIKNATWRTAAAVGICEKTVSRILRDRKKKWIESGVAGTEDIIKGKVGAANDTALALDDFILGNTTASAKHLIDAAGSCIGGDVAALGAVAAGFAGATGKLLGTGAQVAGDLAEGNAAAVGDVGAGISAIASGNITNAVSDFGGAAGALIAGGEAALENLFMG